MPRIFALTAGVSLIIACSFGGGETQPAPVATSEPTALAETPAEDTPPPWELPRTGAAPGALLADWTERAGWQTRSAGGGRAALLPLDADTAEDLTGYEPFNFGHHYTTLLSPDGAVLAAMVGPTQEASSTELTLIDLKTWRPLPVAAGLPAGLDLIGWSPDGRWLFLKHEDYVDGGVSLFRVTATGASAEQIGEAKGLDIRTWSKGMIAPDGSTLYFPAYHGDQCCGIDVHGSPYIIAVDAATGRERGRVDLPAVTYGQEIREVEGGAGAYNVSVHPDALLSADGRRLFVAHADEDRVTVVDTETMAVSDVISLELPRSALSRFGAWFTDQLVSTAEAKGGPSSWRQATLSADGSKLLITGRISTVCPQIQYFECTMEPVGLQILDVQTLQMTHEIADIDKVAITPDGRYLLGAGESWEWRTRSGNADISGHGLRVIDARTFEVAGHVMPDATILSIAISPDSRRAYLLSRGEGSEENEATHVFTCDQDCFRITVVNLDSLRVIGRRSFGDGYLQLVSLGTR